MLSIDGVKPLDFRNFVPISFKQADWSSAKELTLLVLLPPHVVTLFSLLMQFDAFNKQNWFESYEFEQSISGMVYTFWNIITTVFIIIDGKTISIVKTKQWIISKASWQASMKEKTNEWEILQVTHFFYPVVITSYQSTSHSASQPNYYYNKMWSLHGAAGLTDRAGKLVNGHLSVNRPAACWWWSLIVDLTDWPTGQT